MNLDFDWVILQYQDIAGNLGQFAQNLKKRVSLHKTSKMGLIFTNMSK